VGRQQPLDTPAQVGVAAASLLEVGGSFWCWHSQGSEEQGFDRSHLGHGDFPRRRRVSPPNARKAVVRPTPPVSYIRGSDEMVPRETKSEARKTMFTTDL
jgi:hypothetical protein